MSKKYERSISTQRAESLKKRIPMILPMDLDPSPIVPKIHLYPSDFIIDHLILHHFSNNSISWQLLYWFLANFSIFSFPILSILFYHFHPFETLNFLFLHAWTRVWFLILIFLIDSLGCNKNQKIINHAQWRHRQIRILSKEYGYRAKNKLLN